MAAVIGLPGSCVLKGVYFYLQEDVGDLKSACWHSDGQQFVTGHADGNTCIWSVNSAARPTEVKKFYGKSEVEGEDNRWVWSTVHVHLT